MVILDIGAASTKLYIVEYGIVRASHIINRGSQDITLALSRSSGIEVEKAEEIKHLQKLCDTQGEKAFDDYLMKKNT